MIRMTFLYILGIKEIFEWFVLFSNPWFKRGGTFTNGTGSGVNAFNNNNGQVNGNNSFRVDHYD